MEEGPPCLNAIWYTICGSPIHNRAQFTVNILSFVILLSSLFSKIFFKDFKILDAIKDFLLKLKSKLMAAIASQPSAAQPLTAQPSATQPAANVTVTYAFVKRNSFPSHM